MNFIKQDTELFIRINCAAKFLSGYDKPASFLNSFKNNLPIYGHLRGMYRANVETGTVDFYCKGFIAMEDSPYFGEPTFFSNADWGRQQCSLKFSIFTKTTNQQIIQPDTLIYLQDDDHHPRNDNYLEYGYLNLKELAEYCLKTGIEIDSVNIETFCELALNDQFYMIECEIDESAIREDTHIDYLITCFDNIDEFIVESILKKMLRKAKYDLKALDEKIELDKKDNQLQELQEITSSVGNSAWIALGALIKLLNEHDDYKTKSDLKVAIRARYQKIKGLSDRNLDTILKQGTDALSEAIKRYR